MERRGQRDRQPPFPLAPTLRVEIGPASPQVNLAAWLEPPCARARLQTPLVLLPVCLSQHLARVATLPTAACSNCRVIDIYSPSTGSILMIPFYSSWVFCQPLQILFRCKRGNSLFIYLCAHTHTYLHIVPVKLSGFVLLSFNQSTWDNWAIKETWWLKLVPWGTKDRHFLGFPTASTLLYVRSGTLCSWLTTCGCWAPEIWLMP